MCIPMAIHPELTQYVQDVFLPSLSEPHQTTARTLYEQIHKLEALRMRGKEWFVNQPVVCEAFEKEVSDIAVEVREAYRQVIALGEQA
jgi:hypothetical protein